VRWTIFVWVVLVVLGPVLAFAARGAGPLPGDLALSRLIQQPPPNGLVGYLLARASDVVWLLSPLAVLVALLVRQWLAAAFILLASFTGVLVGVVIKALVARPRPTADLVRVYDSPESYSFPSTTAFFAATFLGMVGYLAWQPRRRVGIVTLGTCCSCRAASRACTWGHTGRRMSWAAGFWEALGCSS
jgi:membrane-associated phospholipid phosphatase